MTEPGQSLNLPREWVVGYFANKWLFIVVNLSLLAALWWMNHKYQFWRSILDGMGALVPGYKSFRLVRQDRPVRVGSKLCLDKSL